MRRTRSAGAIVGILVMLSVVSTAQMQNRATDKSTDRQGSWHPAGTPRGIPHDGGTKSTFTEMRRHVDSSVAPEALGQSPADMDVTREIRRAVLDDRSLSPYAHNVQIITRDGLVTLRGPVRSARESMAVEDKAASVVGKANVKNELDVSPGRRRSAGE